MKSNKTVSPLRLSVSLLSLVIFQLSFSQQGTILYHPLTIMPHAAEYLLNRTGNETLVFNKTGIPDSVHIAAPYVYKQAQGSTIQHVFYTEQHQQFTLLKRADVSVQSIVNEEVIDTLPAMVKIAANELKLSPCGTMLALGVSRNKTEKRQIHETDVRIYYLQTNGSLNKTVGSGGITSISLPLPLGTWASVSDICFSATGNRLFVSLYPHGIYYLDYLQKPIPTVMSLTNKLTFSRMVAVSMHGASFILVAGNHHTVYRIADTNASTPGFHLFYAAEQE